MADNRIEDAKEKIAETKQAVEQSAQIAKNIASGNYLAAAKNALKMLKNEKFKKALKKKLIGFALKALIPVIICAVFFASINKIKNEMINLMSSISTSVTGFIKRAWKWMSDDYWIKLDEKSQYVLNLETGEVLDVLEKGETPGVYTDDSGNEIPTIVKEETIVDEYIRQLGNQGLSLRQLRILGDSASSDEEVLLNGGPEKLLAEKYISEFIRADIITQEIHKKHRGGDVVVNPNNQYEIDGGVYLVRIKDEEPELNIADIEVSEEIDENQKYVEMEYMAPDEFLNELGIEGDSFDGYIGQDFTYSVREGKKITKNLRYKYSIDMDTGELIIIEYTAHLTLKSEEANISDYDLFNVPEGASVDEHRNQWMNNQDMYEEVQEDMNKIDQTGEGTYTIKLTSIDYKELISKYSMPYEFLINLCQVTENPEFVYHVALLARDTKIQLCVYDNITRNIEMEANLIDYSEYTNTSPTVPESPSSRNMCKNKEIESTTNVTPIVKIKYADAWSFYDEFEYSRNVEIPKQEQRKTISGGIGSQLRGYRERDSEGVRICEYYDTFERRKDNYIKSIGQSINYPEGYESCSSIEKSKQFLGLLANKTGECPYDCDKELQIVEENGKLTVKNDPEAIKCAKEAVYDKNGIKVSYRIPNTTMMQMPYNNLISGLDMLYALLQSNSNGYVGEDDGTKSDEELNKTSSYDANKDFESKYVGKMQGLVEHLKYLMTFPENEEYERKYLNIENDDIEKDGYVGEDDEYYQEIELLYEDIIIKIDESGAVRRITREELISIICKAYIGKQQENALQLVDTLMIGQDTYKVNPLFMLAILQQETSMGTADTDFVNKDNNWASYNLGKQYSNPQENLLTTIKGIANGSYYFSQGNYTIKQIGLIYCPNEPSHPTQGTKWVNEVSATTSRLYGYIGENNVAKHKENGDSSATVYTSSSGKTYKIYKQQDYKADYGNGSISDRGCNVTAAATVLSAYGCQKNPSQLINGGLKGGVVSADSLVSQNGENANRNNYTANDRNSIVSHLNSGNPVIIRVNSSSSYTSNEHWMPILDIKESSSGTSVYVGNPNKYTMTGWNNIDEVLKGCTDVIYVE